MAVSSAYCKAGISLFASMAGESLDSRDLEALNYYKN